MATACRLVSGKVKISRQNYFGFGGFQPETVVCTILPFKTLSLSKDLFFVWEEGEFEASKRLMNWSEHCLTEKKFAHFFILFLFIEQSFIKRRLV